MGGLSTGRCPASFDSSKDKEDDENYSWLGDGNVLLPDAINFSTYDASTLYQSSSSSAVQLADHRFDHGFFYDVGNLTHVPNESLLQNVSEKSLSKPNLTPSSQVHGEDGVKISELETRLNDDDDPALQEALVLSLSLTHQA